MINHLHIKNFKSHRDTSLALANLNIFAGQNGVGKSSVFQVLLLLRQSFLKNRLHEGIDLNKPLCDIGVAKDAVFQGASDEIIEFSLEFSDQNDIQRWIFDAKDLESTFLPLKEKANDTGLGKSSLFNSDFQYLSAARLGPIESYDSDNYAVERQRQISLEKGQGELVAHFLSHYGKKEKIQSPSLRHPEGLGDFLEDQTTAWEREISEHINVRAEKLASGKFEIRYSFNVPDGEPTDWFRAENVGFGVSYSLPLIVAALSTRKNGMLLIENPEAHLAPYAQSKLAQLMALAAQAGVQVFLETHSDHIINGTLLAIHHHLKNPQTGIAPENVKIFYFDREKNQHSARTVEVPISEDGRIRQAPKGFFDQYKNDIKALV